MNFKLFSILAACQNSRWIILCWSSSNKSKLSQHGCDHGSLTHNRSTSGKQWTPEPLNTKDLNLLYTSIIMQPLLAVLYTFSMALQGEFVEQSRASWLCFHFLFSPDLDVWFRCDIVGRISMLINLRGKRVTCNPSF